MKNLVSRRFRNDPVAVPTLGTRPVTTPVTKWLRRVSIITALVTIPNQVTLGKGGECYQLYQWDPSNGDG